MLGVEMVTQKIGRFGMNNRRARSRKRTIVCGRTTSAVGVATKTDACVPGTARAACSVGVADGLIDYLRLILRRQRLEFVETPVPLLGGFDAAIYGFRLARAPADHSGPLILRVLSDVDLRRARFEAAAQNALWAMGYPAPRTLQVSGPRQDRIPLPGHGASARPPHDGRAPQKSQSAAPAPVRSRPDAGQASRPRPAAAGGGSSDRE